MFFRLLLQKTFIILSFLRMFVKKFFLYFSKTFEPFTSLKQLSLSFFKTFISLSFLLYFVKNFFYNFLTFIILKCLIVRLLLEKTFTILSSSLFLVNIIFHIFSSFFQFFFLFTIYNQILLRYYISIQYKEDFL